MLIVGILILVCITAIYLFMHTARFGAPPSGEGLAKIQHSPNFRDGQFRNLSNTPALTEGTSYFRVLQEFLFDKTKNKIPPSILPSVKTDLLHLDPDRNILVWFGHSSYFIQIDRKTILVDPVFSGNASPLRFTTKSFKGSDIYKTDDFPFIDYLFISHDHWDHLDHKTLLELKSKVRKIITGLGVGAHLESWGYDKNIIVEKDWNEEIILDEGFKVETVPARHFSGRGFKRNGTLWMSFVLFTPSRRIFIGGDSGYDIHFKEIGNHFGPFDLAVLEDGQYDKNWKYIHMTPEETIKAGMDLRANKILPVHWSKFSLSVHSWSDPITRIKNEASRLHTNIIHPMIGQLVDLGRDQVFDEWWQRIT